MSASPFRDASIDNLKQGRQVLYHAGLHLSRNGWRPRRYGVYGGQRCAVGLVNSGAHEVKQWVHADWACAMIALALQTPDSRVLVAFARAESISEVSIGSLAGIAQGTVINWNDVHGRTAKEVMDAIVAAIELLNEEIAARLALTADEVVVSPTEVPELAGIA